uniref:Uncharacterized protein n=1 Tax=Anguilla anguilla TaxID=7936 RepID=A0A0E9V9U2_ANGAN
MKVQIMNFCPKRIHYLAGNKLTECRGPPR